MNNKEKTWLTIYITIILKQKFHTGILGMFQLQRIFIN